MEEILSDRAGCFHLESVGCGKRIHTDELNHFLQLRLILQKVHHLLPECHPVVSIHILIEPSADGIHVVGIACQPVDGREVSLVSKSRIQAPEHLDYTKGCLCNGLGNITACRRNRTDNRKCSLPVIGTEGRHAACSLIELCQTRTKVCGVSFLTGHFLKSSGHLTKSLSPTAGGICKEQDVLQHSDPTTEKEPFRLSVRFLLQVVIFPSPLPRQPFV